MENEQPELTPEEREEQRIREVLAPYSDEDLYNYFTDLILLKREIEEAELAHCAETGELPFWEQPPLFTELDYVPVRTRQTRKYTKGSNIAGGTTSSHKRYKKKPSI